MRMVRTGWPSHHPTTSTVRTSIGEGDCTSLVQPYRRTCASIQSTSTSSVHAAENLLPHFFPVFRANWSGGSSRRASDHSCFRRRRIANPFSTTRNTPPSTTARYDEVDGGGSGGTVAQWFQGARMTLRPDHLTRVSLYPICRIISSANSLHFTSFAPSINRAKSYVTVLARMAFSSPT